MAKKQYLEFIPLAIFLLAGVLTLFKVPYCALIAVLSGGITATLYFPLSAWLFADSDLLLINRILGGVAYSFATVALLFCFLFWANWQFECIMGYCAVLIMTIICLANYKKALYRPFLWRCIFFAVAITLVHAYRGF